MFKFIVAYVILTAMSACMSKSNSSHPVIKPKPNVAPPFEDPEGQDEQEDETPNPLSSGVWGASLFDRRCHLFYSFSSIKENKGRYDVQLVCPGKKEGIALVETYQGDFELTETWNKNYSIQFTPSLSSCGDEAVKFETTSSLTFDGDSMFLDYLKFQNVPHLEFTMRIAPLDRQEGCFSGGSIANFKPAGESL